LRDARAGDQLEVNVLLLGQHADAAFRQLALQAAVGRVEQRHQQRVGEHHAGGIVHQRARQVERVFGLRVRGRGDDGHGCLRKAVASDQ
jgi:hypothetical protein